ncbi:hypothetical protein, partial [Burkholderia sp. LMG 13014]|uniref:hypothetical protein n=1 Tax=Burkholderia sp. LMG 13014 TaxID=2709306 RepID=UPI001962B3A0
MPPRVLPAALRRLCLFVGRVLRVLQRTRTAFGGQNLIEACAVGVPVLIGKHVFNFTQATADAVAAGA